MLKFNKERLPSYVLCAVAAIVLLAIIREISVNLWSFDFTRLSHLSSFGKYVFSSRIFASAKYLSMVFVLAGCTALAYVSVASVAEIDIHKYLRRKPENPEPEPAPAPAPAPEPVKATEARHPAAPKPPPHAVPQAPASEDEDSSANREQLQKKIREIMERMKTREEAEAAAGPAAESRILSRMKAAAPAPAVPPAPAPVPAGARPEMNFASISPADNAKFERTLIASGCKLLSEIRIGSTGIDYIAVSDKIYVIQADATEGSWMASEDAIGDKPALWFSEGANKVSPVARALEAKADVERLVKGKIDMPVEACACLMGSSVVNASDMGRTWSGLGVEVLRLEGGRGADSLGALADKFPAGGHKEADEAEMQRLIGILEAAESPA